MCGKCLHQPMPGKGLQLFSVVELFADRGTIVLESGCYLVNYKGYVRFT